MITSKRDMANAAIVFLTMIGIIVGALIIVGLLGPFLLAFALVALFLIAVSVTRGYGFTGTTIIAGMLIFFGLGLGIQFALGSTIELGYQSTLSAVKLGTVGYSVDEATFSVLLGFAAIMIVVILAFAGLFMRRR